MPWTCRCGAVLGHATSERLEIDDATAKALDVTDARALVECRACGKRRAWYRAR